MPNLTLEEIAATIEDWREERVLRQQQPDDAQEPLALHTRQLGAEWRGYFAALDERSYDIALASGVPFESLANGLVGIARVRMVGDSKWEPDSDPQAPRFFVTPVRVEPGAANPYDIESPNPRLMARKTGELIDIVAWRPKVPDRWLLRTGAAVTLGASEYHALTDEPAPALRVHQGPLEWLRAGGEGIGLLTRDRDERRSLLFGVERIEVQDAKLREELRHTIVARQTSVEAPRQETEVAQLQHRRTLKLRA